LAIADGYVYGATVDSGFALDQETGEQVWKVPLTRDSTESVDMAPGVHDGKVYVSTVPVTPETTYAPGAVGTLYALDAKTGKKEWSWDTVPKGLWGHPEINSGGGLWYPPSFDVKGDVYVGTGNPGPLPGTGEFPYGSSRPGPNLYADSMVKLDPDNGKVIWYYQQTPHNIYDWDFQNPPVLVEAGGKELAIGSGKSGVVVAIDRQTGKPVWKRPAGVHNGHDNDPLYAMRKEYSKIKPGAVYPGELGGIIAPLATDGKMVFVPVINAPQNGGGGTNGEVIALDVQTGVIRWNAEFAASPYGAPTVVNDLVFATTADGVVHALKTETGGEAWQASLPAGTNAGVSVSGEMLIAPAGLAVEEGQTPQLVAFKLGG
ncbi:MAG TPA: PQQ-binding-like beta-propeller repeat protein, partial [Solirubrobacterales bacterium]|nr:PQQ-binding-like beta-propeller repeat protein [Solirubrobacterales bacterium]